MSDPELPVVPAPIYAPAIFATPHELGAHVSTVDLAAVDIDPFPPPCPNRLTPNVKLQAALDKAAQSLPDTAIAIVSLDPFGTRPMAHVRGYEVHYSASLLKVAAMYAAFELRAALRQFAIAVGPATTRGKLLRQAADHFNPKIRDRVRTIAALNGISDLHSLPRYESAFAVRPIPQGPGYWVDFTQAYERHLDGMIARSVNLDAGMCIHGCGYGYLNGALASGGFLRPGANNGMWLAGDYIDPAANYKYPAYRIPSVNDGLSAQAATALDLANLCTLLHDRMIVGVDSSNEMLDLLAAAVAVPEVFINRAASFQCNVTHTKVGMGPLRNGVDIYSEASLVEYPGGWRFVVAWQNYDLGKYGWDWEPLGSAVQEALDEFVAP